MLEFEKLLFYIKIIEINISIKKYLIGLFLLSMKIFNFNK